MYHNGKKGMSAQEHAMAYMAGQYETPLDCYKAEGGVYQSGQSRPRPFDLASALPMAGQPLPFKNLIKMRGE